MRPGKAVVVVYMGEVIGEGLDEIILKGVCGRLVLRKDLVESIFELDSNSSFYSDEILEGTQLFTDPSQLSAASSKVLYLFLHTPQHLPTLISICESSHFFLTLILHPLLPLPPPASPLTPKPSYLFTNCEELPNSFTGSVFYTDYEQHYTRIDWLQSTQDSSLIGANGLILFEHHHNELLSRLGLKSKYGS